MYPSAPELTDKIELTVTPWTDEEVEASGFDIRSAYSETFWLPILGPSVMWLLRSIAGRFDDEPESFVLDFDETARSLGMRFNGSRNSPFNRSLCRVVTFSMGFMVDDDTIAVRTILPRLRPGQLQRLSPMLQTRHHNELRRVAEDEEREADRATHVATTLLSLGDSPDIVERQLVNWGIERRVASLAVNVAWADKARSEQRRADARRWHVESDRKPYGLSESNLLTK